MNPGVFGLPKRRLPVVFDASFLRGHLFGFMLSNDAGDLTNDIGITGGVCVDQLGTRFIKLNAPIVRQLDVGFGNGNGGLSSSLVAGLANGTYHVFAVITSTGGSSVAMDTSVVAATLIADHGILAWRRIGSIVRAGGAIRAFLQNGDRFIWAADGILSVSDTNPGIGDLTGTAAVPLGIVVEALLAVTLDTVGSTGINCSVWSLDQTSVAASANNNLASISVAGGADAQSSARGQVKTNTSGQFRYRLGVSAAGDQVRIATLGYVDYRGRYA